MKILGGPQGSSVYARERAVRSLGSSGRNSRGIGARSRSGVADDRLHHRSSASARGGRKPAKRGAMPRALAGVGGLEHENPHRRRRPRQSGAAHRGRHGSAKTSPSRTSSSRATPLPSRSSTKATTTITSVTESPRAEARSASRQSATGPSSAPIRRPVQ